MPLNAPSFILPPDIARPLERSWSEDEAFAFCKRLTKSHYENFPVGSFLAPAALQSAIHSLYAFMRTADDFSDENRMPGDEAERLAFLSSWEAMLADCEKGEARHPIFIALRSTLRQHQLPVQLLKDLLTAFKMDVTVRRYADYRELERYCRYSANPVGRLILALFGYRDEKLNKLSDSICTALQLANHWQDAAIDLGKNRIYLPQEDLKRFAVLEASLFEHVIDGNFRNLMAFEVERARKLFEGGKSLPACVRGRLRLELRMTWLGGYCILDKIEAAQYDVFHKRPSVTKLDWARLFVKAVL
jgi:squalene synthase HpnC